MKNKIGILLAIVILLVFINKSSATQLYDEQLGLSFTQNWTSLAYNVTAVARNDTSGIGPAYLLNGCTNQGYWYQVGLSYNWLSTVAAMIMDSV